MQVIAEGRGEQSGLVLGYKAVHTESEAGEPQPHAHPLAKTISLVSRQHPLCSPPTPLTPCALCCHPAATGCSCLPSPCPAWCAHQMLMKKSLPLWTLVPILVLLNVRAGVFILEGCSKVALFSMICDLFPYKVGGKTRVRLWISMAFFTIGVYSL